MTNWLSKLLSGDVFKAEAVDGTTMDDKIRRQAGANAYVASALEAKQKESGVEKVASVTALIDPDRKKTIEALSNENLAAMLTELTLRFDEEYVSENWVTRYPGMLELVLKNRKKAESDLFSMIPKHTMAKTAALSQIWTVSKGEDGSESIVRLFDDLPKEADTKELCTTLLSGVSYLSVGDSIKNASFESVAVGTKGVVSRIDPTASKSLSVFCQFDKVGGYWLSPDQIELVGRGSLCRSASLSKEAETVGDQQDVIKKIVAQDRPYAETAAMIKAQYPDLPFTEGDHERIKAEIVAAPLEKAFTGKPPKGDNLNKQIPAPYRAADEDNYTPNTSDFGTVPDIRERLAPGKMSSLSKFDLVAKKAPSHEEGSDTEWGSEFFKLEQDFLNFVGGAIGTPEEAPGVTKPQLDQLLIAWMSSPLAQQYDFSNSDKDELVSWVAEFLGNHGFVVADQLSKFDKVAEGIQNCELCGKPGKLDWYGDNDDASAACSECGPVYAEKLEAWYKTDRAGEHPGDAMRAVNKKAAVDPSIFQQVLQMYAKNKGKRVEDLTYEDYQTVVKALEDNETQPQELVMASLKEKYPNARWRTLSTGEYCIEVPGKPEEYRTFDANEKQLMLSVIAFRVLAKGERAKIKDLRKRLDDSDDPQEIKHLCDAIDAIETRMEKETERREKRKKEKSEKAEKSQEFSGESTSGASADPTGESDFDVTKAPVAKTAMRDKVLDQLAGQMVRKPQSVDEASRKVITPTPEQMAKIKSLPTFEWEKLFDSEEPGLDFLHAAPGQWMTVKYNGKLFLINNEGYDYARYMAMVQMPEEGEVTAAKTQYVEEATGLVKKPEDLGMDPNNSDPTKTPDELKTQDGKVLKKQVVEARVSLSKFAEDEGGPYEYKFIVPVTASKWVEGEEQDPDDEDSGSEPGMVDIPFDEIPESALEAMAADFNSSELEQYMRPDEFPNMKIMSLTMSFPSNGRAIVTALSPGELTPEQIESVADWLNGQCSDGWGEGFEQRDLEGGVNIHTWSHNGPGVKPANAPVKKSPENPA